MQALIDNVKHQIEIDIIRESVKNQVLQLCLDNNGTHVIQKIITCVPEESRDFINQVVLKHLTELINDSNGISVAKKFVNGNKSLEIRELILSMISKNALNIIQNSFGNYMVQHIFAVF